MKMKLTLKTLALVLALAATSVAQSTQQSPQQVKEERGNVLGEVSGQDPKTKTTAQKDDAQQAVTPAKSSAQATEQKPASPATAPPQSDKANKLPSDIPAELQAGRRGNAAEEEAAAIVPYYNSYLSTFRIGPEDVISVSVFNQPNYSRAGITVPPNGKISYPLIPEGIVVVGKTTEQIQAELTKRLDEYIIDPQITVSLDKAVSATYSVIGDVAQPGVRTMTHRYSITEALAMAGGVLNTGDKSKVFILRQQADGNVKPIFVNVKEIEKGRAKEMAFLVPGDQVVVPGNRLKSFKTVLDMMQVLNFARIFTGGW